MMPKGRKYLPYGLTKSKTGTFAEEEKVIVLSLLQTKNNIQIGRLIGRSAKQIGNFLYVHGFKRKNLLPRNEEWRHKISLANKGKMKTEEHKQKKTEEHKQKLSLKTKLQFQNGMPIETKLKISAKNSGDGNYFYGKKHTLETRMKLRLQKLGKPNNQHSENLRKLFAEGKIQPWNKGKHGVFSEETIEKIRLKNKAHGFFKRKNQEPEFTKKRLKGLIKRPTKPEKQLQHLLDSRFPNEWKYVGNGQVLIDNLNPDFIHRTDKKVIEVFGDYWHDSRRNKVVTENERQLRLGKYGYDMLVIRESELKNENQVIDKIQSW